MLWIVFEQTSRENFYVHYVGENRSVAIDCFQSALFMNGIDTFFDLTLNTSRCITVGFDLSLDLWKNWYEKYNEVEKTDVYEFTPEDIELFTDNFNSALCLYTVNSFNFKEVPITSTCSDCGKTTPYLRKTAGGYGAFLCNDCYNNNYLFDMDGSGVVKGQTEFVFALAEGTLKIGALTDNEKSCIKKAWNKYKNDLGAPASVIADVEARAKTTGLKL